MDERRLAAEMRQNSERWFPQMHDGTFDLRTFYALGLVGEAGEVANVVKKGLRSGALDLLDLGAELADVFTYLLLLADECGIDLVDEYHAKVEVNEARWGAVLDKGEPDDLLCRPGAPCSARCERCCPPGYCQNCGKRGRDHSPMAECWPEGVQP